MMPSRAGGADPSLELALARDLPGLVRRYELLYELAAGGMATVYLGRPRVSAGPAVPLAIKVCHPHLRHDGDFAAMFLDEVRLTLRIRHPNVIPTLDAGQDDELYLVMEYVEGVPVSELLRDLAAREAHMPPAVALAILVGALRGLHAAHTATDERGRPLNVVHRDVSPQNVLLGVDGVARLMDFGIAKAEARLTSTRDGAVKGKFAYMAPEQIRRGPVDRRADLFAAGVVLWETLTGFRLFRGENEAETINAVLAMPVPAPTEMQPALPPALDRLALRALDRDPAARFASAAEFADALERVPGLAPAAPADVAAYLESVCHARLARRRALYEWTFRETTTTRSERSQPPPPRALADDGATALEQQPHAVTIVDVPAATHERVVMPDGTATRGPVDRPRRGLRATLGALGALATVVAVAVGAARVRGEALAPPARAAPSAPLAAPVTPAPRVEPTANRPAAPEPAVHAPDAAATTATPAADVPPDESAPPPTPRAASSSRARVRRRLERTSPERHSGGGNSPARRDGEYIPPL